MSRQQVTVAVSDEMLAAIDREAFETDASRAAFIRGVLADHLREAGSMRSTDPTTTSQGQNNPYFRPRRGRP